MRDLRAHLTTTLRDCRLGPSGAGYAIVDESIVRAEDRTFITLLARAAQQSGQDTGVGGGDGNDDDTGFRRLLLGQHLGRRARQEPETRVVYEDYLRHHRRWFAKLLAVRGSGKGGEGATAVDPAVRALVAIERELSELDLDRPEPM